MLRGWYLKCAKIKLDDDDSQDDLYYWPERPYSSVNHDWRFFCQLYILHFWLFSAKMVGTRGECSVENLMRKNLHAKQVEQTIVTLLFSANVCIVLELDVLYTCLLYYTKHCLSHSLFSFKMDLILRNIVYLYRADVQTAYHHLTFSVFHITFKHTCSTSGRDECLVFFWVNVMEKKGLCDTCPLLSS